MPVDPYYVAGQVGAGAAALLGAGAGVANAIPYIATGVKRLREVSEIDDDLAQNRWFGGRYNESKRYLSNATRNLLFGPPVTGVVASRRPYISYPMAFSKRRRPLRRRPVRRRRRAGYSSSVMRRRGSAMYSGHIVKRFPGGKFSYSASKFGRDIPFAAPARPLPQPYHFQLGVANGIAADGSGTDSPRVISNYPTTTPLGQDSPLFMCHNIAKGTSIHQRSGPMLFLHRLEIRGNFTLGDQANWNTCRVSLILDKHRPLPLSSTNPSPNLIFQEATSTVSGASAKGDPFCYFNQDVRDRFSILYQETFDLKRGILASTAPDTYSANDMTIKTYARDIYLRGIRQSYEQDTVSGALSDVLGGALFVCVQAGGLRNNITPAGVTGHSGVSYSLNTRLTWMDPS